MLDNFKDDEVLKNESLFQKFIKAYTIWFLVTSILFLLIFLGFSSFFMNSNEFIDFLVLFIIFDISLFILSFIITKHFFNKFITKRIDIIKNELYSILKGDFSYRIKTKGFDEIDKLAYISNKIFDKYHEMYKKEKEMSLVDPLTKAYNRRALYLEFKQLIHKAIRNKKSISFLIFDIDDFKKVNDVFGHDVGDKVLKTIVKSLKKTLRPYDKIYRIGGEEFLILFYDLKKENEKKLLDRILKVIPEAIKKEVKEIRKRKVTISGGYKRIEPKNIKKDLEFDPILKEIDELLYYSKKHGKNQINK
jgi:diguanylate cyclase (GGDEF)-like protein